MIWINVKPGVFIERSSVISIIRVSRDVCWLKQINGDSFEVSTNIATEFFAGLITASFAREETAVKEDVFEVRVVR